MLEKKMNKVTVICTALLYLLVCFADLGYVNGAIVLSLSLALIIIIFKQFRLKYGYEQSILFLMNLSLPISFRSVTGSEFADLPLPWFYVFGVLFFFNSLGSKSWKGSKDINAIIVFTLLLSFIPLFLSNDIMEGFKEMLTYDFFLLMMLAANNSRTIMGDKERLLFYDTFVFGCLFATVGIIYQYYSYVYMGVETFRMEFYGGGRIFLGFLFYDMSSVSLYMVTGAMMMVVREDRGKLVNYIIAILILIGTTASSARTGLVAFVIFASLYIFTSRKVGMTARTLLSVMLVGGAIFAFSIMGQVRDTSGGASFLADDNGRFSTYRDGILAFLENPLFGIGYDMPRQLSSMGKMVPHFALINIIGQTGIIITFLIICILYSVYKKAKIKKDTVLLWAILLSYFGSCLVPGFFSTRYFTMLGILAFLGISRENKYH